MKYRYWIKQFLIIALSIIGIILGYKFFIFYMPFLIAYIISLLVEPLIKKLAEKINITRKTSSIIVLTLVFVILIIIIAWIFFSIFKEASNLLTGLNQILDKSISFVSDINKRMDFDKFQISSELKQIFENTSVELISKGGELLKNILGEILNTITEIPNMLIYLIITVLATYFITSDKFYILDRMEHHLPHKWMKNIIKHSKSITKTLSGYLKAEITMILISFVIVLIGLHIFYFLGMNVKYPILMAVFIMFVDALPIIGSGTVMVPWGIIEIVNKDTSLGFSILGLFVFTVVAKQLLEPKIVSNKIGVHPIFTLIAMYTGFKLIGIIGLLVGPIMLIILKNILAPFVEEGFLKSIFKID